MADFDEEDLTKPKIQKPDILRSDYLSSGSTILNLACSGTPYGAFIKGGFHWIVGDSDTGKTFLVYTCFAEAANDPNWDGYDLIADDVENGALMDKSAYFGKKAAERMKAPAYDKEGDPLFSETVDDFYFSLDARLDLVEKGKALPFLWALDSMDALSSKYEGKRFEMRKSAHEDGKEAKGDFADGKAKVNSQNIRRIKQRLRKNRCTLIILSQTRDNVDAGMFESKSTVAGGRSLKFYSVWQLWSSPGGTITRSFRGIERQLGIISRIKIKKNHLTGKNWSLSLPIYHAHGIDDIESCIDYLVDEGKWKKSNSKIVAPEFDLETTKEKFICQIQEDDLEPKLRKIVTDVWQETEAKLRPVRKPRYQ